MRKGACISLCDCCPSLCYLRNVINATGIRPHPLLSHVRLVLMQDPSALVRGIELLPCKEPMLASDCLSSVLLYAVHTISGTGKTKGAVGYLLKFDHTLIGAIAKGCKVSP